MFDLVLPVLQPAFLELFDKHKDSKGKQAKLKSPVQLQELLDITRQLLSSMDEKHKEARKETAVGGEEERSEVVSGLGFRI
jgi:inositol hexakisphosphate/diphosphoinositol-pentakisphosphate kinase